MFVKSIAAIAIVASFFVTPAARASEIVVGAHVVSLHETSGIMRYDSNTGALKETKLRSWTPGVYAKFGDSSGVTIGLYKNSIGRVSAYVGYTFEATLTDKVSAAVTAGIISGYDKHEYSVGDVSPLLAPSFSVALDNKTRLRTIIIPRAGEFNRVLTINFAIEFKR